VQVDVATLEQAGESNDTGSGANVAVAPAWAPPATDLVLPTVFPDEIEVQVYSTTAGASAAGWDNRWASITNKGNDWFEQAHPITSFVSRRCGCGMRFAGAVARARRRCGEG
jgi:hypothetical protein